MGAVLGLSSSSLSFAFLCVAFIFRHDLLTFGKDDHRTLGSGAWDTVVNSKKGKDLAVWKA